MQFLLVVNPGQPVKTRRRQLGPGIQLRRGRQRSYYVGAYFQDDWKVSSQLTLNLGVRWDFFSLVGEKYGAQANFVPGANPQFIIPASRKDLPGVSQSFQALLAKDGINLVYSDDWGSGLGDAQKLTLHRASVLPTGRPKFVVRGGYGFSTALLRIAEDIRTWATITRSSSTSASPLRTPDARQYADGATGTLENGLLHIPLDPTLVNGSGLNLRGIELDYKTPYTQSANLTLQYELLTHDSFEVGYVGTLTAIWRLLPAQPTFVLLPPGTDPSPTFPSRFRPRTPFARLGTEQLQLSAKQVQSPVQRRPPCSSPTRTPRPSLTPATC